MPADSAAGEVAFTGSAAMILPVHLNGQGPLHFALDTGSTLTCVDHRVAERLDLPEEEGMPGVTAGASGVGRMRVVRLDSLRVGGASMSALPACVVELAHARRVGVEIDGLLGLNFLRAYRVEIDFGRGVLALRNPSAQP
jgi:predicted aspartyl protease